MSLKMHTLLACISHFSSSVFFFFFLTLYLCSTRHLVPLLCSSRSLLACQQTGLFSPHPHLSPFTLLFVLLRHASLLVFLTHKFHLPKSQNPLHLKATRTSIFLLCLLTDLLNLISVPAWFLHLCPNHLQHVLPSHIQPILFHPPVSHLPDSFVSHIPRLRFTL